MILETRNSFQLMTRDTNLSLYSNGKMCDLPISAGLIIKKTVNTELIDIATIQWDPLINNCETVLVGDRLQNYVLTELDYKCFVYLLDVAYDLIGQAFNYKIAIT